MQRTSSSYMRSGTSRPSYTQKASPRRTKSSKKLLAFLLAGILLVSAAAAGFVVFVVLGGQLDTPVILTVNAHSAVSRTGETESNERFTLDQYGRLNWSSVSNAVGYNVFVEHGDSLEFVTSTNTNSALIEGLPNNQPAAFRVQAVASNVSRNSELSNVAEIIVTLPLGTRRLNQPMPYLDEQQNNLLWQGVDFRTVNDSGVLQGQESSGYYRVVTSTGNVINSNVRHLGRGGQLHVVDVSSVPTGTSLRVMALSDDDRLASSQWSGLVTIDRTTSLPPTTNPPVAPPVDETPTDPTDDKYELVRRGNIIEWNTVSRATNYIVHAQQNNSTEWVNLGWVGQSTTSTVSFDLANASWLHWSQGPELTRVSVIGESWADTAPFERSQSIIVDFNQVADAPSGPGNSGSDNSGGGGNVTAPPAPPATAPPSGGWIDNGHRERDIPASFWTTGAGRGTTPFVNPNEAIARLHRFLPRSDFEALFPNRFGRGNGVWFTNNAHVYRPDVDYYSYANLEAAIRFLSHITIIVEMRADQQPSGLVPIPWTQQIVMLHSSNRTRGIVVREGEDFDAEWNRARPVYTRVANMGDFLNYSSSGVEAIHGYREMAAFLANLTQETSGGTTGQDDRLTHGLWWNEEIGFEGNQSRSYFLDGHYFPPMRHPDYDHYNSYHGRGPIQLSWNYNYGLFSGIFFGDARILLERPEYIIRGMDMSRHAGAQEKFGVSRLDGGTLAWMTAIAFWMMPQPPKPSAHEVMMGTWRPDTLDQNQGRWTGVDEAVANRPNVTVTSQGRQITFDGNVSRARLNEHHSIGFIMTVMIINGGLEGNRHLFHGIAPTGQPTQLHTRVLMYLKITGRMQESNPNVRTSGLGATNLGIRDFAMREKLNSLGMFGY